MYKDEDVQRMDTGGSLTVEYFVEFAWWGVFYEIGSDPYLQDKSTNLSLQTDPCKGHTLHITKINAVPFLYPRWVHRNLPF